MTAGSPLTAYADPQDEAEADRQRVEQQVDGAGAELTESSAAFAAASQALTEAQGRLDQAQAELAATRAELEVARQRDVETAAALVEAERRLAEAEAQIERSEQELENQQADIGTLAVEMFVSPESQMSGMRAFFGATDSRDLLSQLEASDTVVEAQESELDRLGINRALVSSQRARVAATRDEIAELRRQAAENLVRMQELEVAAVAQEQSVADLVAQRETARQQAEAAQAEDQRQYDELVAERQRIEVRLQQLAAEARARAEAEAAAAAAAAAASARDAASAAEARERAQRAAAEPAPSGGPLIMPVNGRITSPYGMRRHPILNYSKLHDGTDFGAGCGTPIRAATGGTVVDVYFNSGYGNRVIIDHGLVDGVGLATSYNHLSSFGTSPGDQVSQGDVIGRVGTTGMSTGCHLHYMVYEDGSTVNPMSWY